jgi:hypothetical protein
MPVIDEAIRSPLLSLEKHRLSNFYYKEHPMTQNYDEDANETNVLAKLIGLPYKVDVSQELKDLLIPNEFLVGLGIRYSERIKIILNSLKGRLIPKTEGMEEAIPKEGVVFPLALATGPFIKEELVSISAELTDNDGEARISLTVVHEE